MTDIRHGKAGAAQSPAGTDSAAAAGVGQGDAVADLTATAVDVLGTVEGASTWLNRPHPALDDETPRHRARTPQGLQRVRSMLGALKHGGAA